MDKFNNIFAKLKGWQKYAIFMTAFAIITIVSFVYFMPDGYSKLYENLAEDDKQQISVELSKMGVDFKFDDTGNTLMVKDKDVAWVRQEMNNLGLPKNTTSKGYELLLENSLGATQADKAAREMIARKGQLENDLVRSFPMIETATVNLTLPEKTSIFAEETAKGSASVTLGLKTGTTLNAQQISGIQNMVSSAITGVKPEEVVVIDGKKGVISGESDLTQSSLSSAYEKQMQIKAQTEQQLHNEIQRALVSTLGYDNFKLNVNVAINFDEIVRNIEKFDPQGTLRSRNSNKETTVKTDGTTNPEAGTDSNGEVPGYEVGTGNGTVKYEQNKENIIENFEIGKTVETIKKNPELTNTNIVVWVDKETLDKKQININQFREAIGIAAGMTLNQDGTFANGQVNVMTMGFEAVPNNPETATNEDEKQGLEKILSDYFIFIIIGAVVLIAALLVLVILLSKKKKRKVEAANDEMLLRAIQERADQDISNGNGAGSQLENYEVGDPVNESSEAKAKRESREREHKEIIEQVKSLSNEYPRESAEYIRKLLNNRK